jgi:CSLREA domain-containing protein
MVTRRSRFLLWRTGLDTFALRLWLGSLVFLLVFVAGPARAATFVVDSTGDAADAVLDGACATGGAVCTLRAAIQEANNTVPADIINFAIPGPAPYTIVLGSDLPAISRRVTIDGTTQVGWAAGAPVVELNGTGANNLGVLTLSAPNSSGSIIRGLVINRSPKIAIRIFSSNNVIAGNFLGTDVTGALPSGNAVGVYITGGTNNQVDGTTAVGRNVISANNPDGIQIDGAGGTSANIVRGNYIGLNAAGTAALGNSSAGVAIFSGSPNNTIGGTAVGAGNVISANGNGITINNAGTTGNLVQGNLIGTDWTGAVAIGNTSRGVSFDQSSANNTVGGTVAGAGNTIAHNGTMGVWIAGSATANPVLGNAIFANGALGIDLNANGVDINDTGDGDSGSNNLQNHPVLSAAMTNGAGTATFAGSLNSAASTTYRVEFFAGGAVDPSGYGEGQRYLGFTNVTTNAAGNAIVGVTLATSLTAGEYVTATATDPSNNTSEFGGAVVAAGHPVVTTTADTADGDTSTVSNLIATPGADGRISLREAIQAANNTAGTDTIRFGIPITDANHRYYQDNGIGGSFSAPTTTTLADLSTPSSPVITNYDADYPAGHARSWYRIQLLSALPLITDAIDLDSTTQPLSIASSGPVIEIDGNSGSTTTLDLQAGSSGSTIRGLVINRAPPPSGNAILVRSSNNVIAGNYLGTNVAGTAAGPGNGVGVRISGGAGASSNNRIGGTTSADRNVISANNLDGVMISGGSGGAANNLVQGNYIGLDPSGTLDVGNTNQGIAVFGTSNTNNVIGGTAPGAGNVISGNGGHGIHMHDVGITGTLVQGNKIGTNALGTAGIPNGGDGVRLYLSTSNNTVGGTAGNAGNLIAFNGGDGVALLADAGTSNSILGNTIHSNGGLGIDLNQDGVTANDALDADGGPNSLLNFPLLTSVFASGGNLTVNFKLDVPAGSYRIEFFNNPTAPDQDASGYGEGKVVAGSKNVTHPGGGPVFFNHIFTGVVTDVITATTTACTDGATCAAFGSTSEFAKNMQAVTTAVKVLSFAAVGRDRATDLSWATASELDNLGFHLYRSTSASGPFNRITSAVIPGLGSSAVGTGYSYRDSGLTNGVTYFYKLEDIDTSGVTTLHGPVSATPSATADDGGGDADASPGPGSTAYGDPAANSLTILERDAQHLLLELRTGGFYASQNPDGTVEISIPGFDQRSLPGDPALPSRHTWVETTAGRNVQITSVQASDPLSVPGLRPSPAALPSIDVSRSGVVRPARSPRHESPAFRRGLFPRRAARILGTGFQQQTKKAELELSPLRFNPASAKLLLSRRLLVRLDFTGVDPGEIAFGGSQGRRPDARLRPSPGPGVIARLAVHDKGLYKLPFADVFGSARTALPLSSLSLTHQGQPVAFHVDRSSFGPGSSLYFLSHGASPDSQEAVYELTRQTGGRRMSTASASASGASTLYYFQKLDLEQNKTYQSGLLDAPELWLWDVLVSPVTKTYPFSIDQLASTTESAHLTVWLQGASDFDVSPDHHVRLFVNGILVGEASWDAKLPKTIEADLNPGVLLEGQNQLEIQNVGDTPAATSMVILDRFSISYPRLTTAVNGVLEGRFTESGTVEVSGLGSDSVLLDTTEAAPRWLTGVSLGPSGLRFRAETSHSYVAVSPSALLRPEVRRPFASDLKNVRNRADYLLVAPRDFLAIAQPLLDLRQSQGLRTKPVAIEDVYDQFGFGEASPDALKTFLAFAYHFWQKPSPRYVLLLGDATYDPKDFLKTGVKNRVPPLMTKTSYLWTASDPAYAAVNGSDSLPDLAFGRLPAQTTDEARILIDKIVAFESQGRDFSGHVVLVADNADVAGEFEQDADNVANSLFQNRTVEKVYLRDLGAATRTTIRSAFDSGPSIVNYIGHGGIAVWASENIWNNLDVNSLASQPQQPLLFTMNCLNGYFHFPSLNSLAEQFLKAEGKGAIAAFAPSGLSVDAPAHAYHKLVLEEITSARHNRLGDAVLAAQNAYAASGDFPELLDIYHLFGDPALRIR